MIDQQSLTHRLYSKMYEKIAEEYYNSHNPNNPIQISPFIELDEF